MDEDPVVQDRKRSWYIRLQVRIHSAFVAAVLPRRRCPSICYQPDTWGWATTPACTIRKFKALRSLSLTVKEESCIDPCRRPGTAQGNLKNACQGNIFTMEEITMPISCQTAVTTSTCSTTSSSTRRELKVRIL